MLAFLLFLGGHDQGGASIDWSTFLGSHPDLPAAKAAVPVSSYYAVIDAATGAIAAKGCRDADGNFHPVMP
jgi:hypothetical protein